MKTLLSLLALPLLAFAVAAVAADTGEGKDEQWSVNVKAQMTKPMTMAMPAMTHTVCAPPDEDMGPPDTEGSECTVDHFEKSGNRVTYKATCTMQGGTMTGEGWSEKSDASHYKGEMRIEGEASGMPVAMTMTYDGTRTGHCTAKK